jgi:cysteinyl-tRNA synthetase
MANVWLHNGFLSMDAQKMSKSLGNVAHVHDMLKRYDGETIRLALLSAHYRGPLDWTDALLAQSQATLDRLYNALRRISSAQPADEPPPAGVLNALCDDLNTPQALAELSALAAEANKADPADWPRLRAQMKAAGDLLGLLSKDPEVWARGDEATARRIDERVAARLEARRSKNFAEADRIRRELEGEGVEVMDSPQGSTWRRIRGLGQ